MKGIERKQLLAVLSSILLFAAVLLMGTGVTTISVYAASGTVYSCTIHPCYKHPITGEIEDSGGESSYATGQGMVEGAVSTTGILEEADSGEYYLTIRLSLMDYTSNHSFWVQSWGASEWSSPALGITGTGTDSNGTTNDICIQIPDKECVVRGSMYVEPMGRDVIFYLYPSDYKSGNSTDMTATMVTEASGSDTSETTKAASESSAAAESTTESTKSKDKNAETTAAAKTETKAASKAETTTASQTDTAATADSDEDESSLNKAQGLSLSTEEEVSAQVTEEAAASGTGAYTMGEQILINIVSFTVSGLILLIAAAFVVYLFIKNWRRWFGDDEDFADDDEE